jgi:hypothetical protein
MPQIREEKFILTSSLKREEELPTPNSQLPRKMCTVCQEEEPDWLKYSEKKSEPNKTRMKET